MGNFPTLRTILTCAAHLKKASESSYLLSVSVKPSCIAFPFLAVSIGTPVKKTIGFKASTRSALPAYPPRFPCLPCSSRPSHQLHPSHQPHQPHQPHPPHFPTKQEWSRAVLSYSLAATVHATVYGRMRFQYAMPRSPSSAARA